MKLLEKKDTRGGAPSIGQDNEKILSQLLGYSDDKMKELEDKGIIQFQKEPVLNTEEKKY